MSNNDELEVKVDRTGWDPGPWDSEPDKLNWRTRAGLPGMIVRNRQGALCGYVAVTKGHPCFERSYSSTYEAGPDGEPDFARPLPNPVDALSVHGGITYGDKCQHAICHVPEPGEPDDVWWLGFDCNHAGDYAPADARWRKEAMPGKAHLFACGSHETYRDLAYVREEVESLAAQLAACAPPEKGGSTKEEKP